MVIQASGSGPLYLRWHPHPHLAPIGPEPGVNTHTRRLTSLPSPQTTDIGSQGDCPSNDRTPVALVSADLTPAH